MDHTGDSPGDFLHVQVTRFGSHSESHWSLPERVFVSEGEGRIPREGWKSEKVEGASRTVGMHVAGIQSPQPHLLMPGLGARSPIPNVLRHLIDVKHRGWSRGRLVQSCAGAVAHP